MGASPSALWETRFSRVSQGALRGGAHNTGDPPKSRLINRRKTYGAKIPGQVIAVEGSEVNDTSCNGAVGAAEARSKVRLAESLGGNRATVKWP